MGVLLFMQFLILLKWTLISFMSEKLLHKTHSFPSASHHPGETKQQQKLKINKTRTLIKSQKIKIKQF